jgi:hypothetical protein
MDEETKKEIEEIIGKMQCPNDFQCYQSGLETLCKAKLVGTKDFLLCLEKKPLKCKFLSVGKGYVCECPLRYYIYSKLNK